MHPIPRPDVFDPERAMSDEREGMTVDEHRARAAEAIDALKDLREYGVILWEHLDLARHYLYDSLPSDPRQPGTTPRLSASPTGPDDEDGWSRWMAAYAEVTSALAGPHGDSGFGASEAKLEAQRRRSAPNVRVAVEMHEALQADRAEQAARAAAPPKPTPPPREPESPEKAPSSRGSRLKSAGIGVLTVLAIRGLFAGRRAPR
jgi:hypothetical protein